MGVLVREANLDTELELLQSTVNASFGSNVSLARFRWLYLDNPDGRAVAWVVVEEGTGAIVGCTAVSPRRVRLGGIGHEVLAWNCGDFSIAAKYRTMGVAVKLRRAAREAIDAGQSAFLYAHPNDRMLQVHLRVGHSPLGRMVRYARPLRLATGHAGLDALSQVALRATGVDSLVTRRYEIEHVQNAVLPRDIDEVYHAAAHRLGTAVVRDRRYLSWRFSANPEERTETIIARKGATPMAYVVFGPKDGGATIKDWLGVDARATEQVFAALLRELRRRQVRSASLTLLETHRDTPLLKRFGFVARPDVTTAVTYAPAAASHCSAVMDPAMWYMTLGDRDV